MYVCMYVYMYVCIYVHMCVLYTSVSVMNTREIRASTKIGRHVHSCTYGDLEHVVDAHTCCRLARLGADSKFTARQERSKPVIPGVLFHLRSFALLQKKKGEKKRKIAR